MWIHVPSQYVPATEESSWDSAQLCQELERSATWKTKPRLAKSWERVLKTDSLTTHLSGLTSEPSMRQRGVDGFISSLEAFPVSPTAWQETGRAPTTQGNSQEKSSESQKNSDTQLSFSKMFPELESSGTTPLDQDYKAWDTELRKSSSLRLKQAPHIRGSDYSSLPNMWGTVTQDSTTMREKRYAQGGTPLTLQASRWATVRVSSANGPSQSELEQGNPKKRLETQAALWPTPQSRDYKGFAPKGRSMSTQDATPYLSILRDPMTHGDGSPCTPKCRRLSPLFAEWLMGLPPGWTNVSEPLATESFLHHQLELGKFLAGDF